VRSEIDFFIYYDIIKTKTSVITLKICATIAEFNPFHNGHAYMMNAVSGDFDASVAVMSGNFVQRGAPAVYDKFSRGRAAVKNGVDLVVELPIIYALSSAESFALGAIKILNAAGVIDSVVFGSECGDIDLLTEIAAAGENEDDEFKAALKDNLASGMSYPKAKSAVLQKAGISSEVLSSPNNILGIEYISAIRKTKSAIKPITLKRYGALHDSNIASNSIASASHVRRLIENGSFTSNFMPSYPYPSPVFEKQFSDILIYALRRADYENLIRIPDCSPALASRFITSRRETDVQSIISAVNAKNFTESRIRRILWNLTLHNSMSPFTEPEYIRIIAQNERGSAVISEMKKHASLPVIQKGVDLKGNRIFELESKATDIYNIVRKIPSGEDFRHSPVVTR